MYKNRKILGLIPARGGSKRLPGKNKKNLLGKPLIAWTIEQACSSKYLDEVVISTEDKEIAAISRAYKDVIMLPRPKVLASDKAKIYDAIEHVLDSLKKKNATFDYIALFEPTSPLRAKDDIDKAIALLIDSGQKADSLVSLGEVIIEHPYMAKCIGQDGYIRPFTETKASFNRMQDIPEKAYIPYGVIYMSKVDALKQFKTFYQSKTLPYFIQRWQNYEVDDKFDFIAIEGILKDYLNT